MDFTHHLFRCSSLGHLMTDVQGKTNFEKWQDAQSRFDRLKTELSEIKQFDAKGKEMKSWQNKAIAVQKAREMAAEFELIKDEVELSETARVHLSDIHTQATTGRQTDITNKFIEKGLMVEEDGITVYSRVKKKFFKKNETHLKNLFIMGTPDLYEGNSIHEATAVPDIKCSWDLYTFRRTFVKKLNQLYYWQLQGYMWLTGALNAPLAYCLVNTPEPLIEAAKRSLWFKMGQPDEGNITYIEGCAEIEKSMTYDDLPLNQKLLEYVVERDEAAQELIKKKVIAGRKYLQWLDDELNKKQA